MDRVNIYNIMKMFGSVVALAIKNGHEMVWVWLARLVLL